MAASNPGDDYVFPKEKRMDILRDIERNCKPFISGKRKVETVLMIGRTGMGKSAAINTIAKLVNGEYRPIAKVGSGVDQSKTKELLMYTNLGANIDIGRKPGDKDEDGVFKTITPYLPHIIDCAGMDDTNNDDLKDILRLLISGRIPPGRSVLALTYRFWRRWWSLRKPNADWKVTKIVFVHSCQQSVPSDLIKCLLSVLTATETGSTALTFTGDIYVLITKYDLVDPMAATKNTNKHIVSMDDFEKIRSQLAREFSVGGEEEHNIFHFASFCSNTGYDDNNYVEELALNLIKHLVMPTNTDLKSWWRMWWWNGVFYFSVVIACLCVLIIL